MYTKMELEYIEERRYPRRRFWCKMCGVDYLEDVDTNEEICPACERDVSQSTNEEDNKCEE